MMATLIIITIATSTVMAIRNSQKNYETYNSQCGTYPHCINSSFIRLSARFFVLLWVGSNSYQFLCVKQFIKFISCQLFIRRHILQRKVIIIIKVLISCLIMWSWLCCKGNDSQQPRRKSRKVPNSPVLLKNKTSTQSLGAQSKNKGQLLQKQQQMVKEIVIKKDTYVGQEMNGVPHGTGTMNYVNGDYYKGEWVNGVKEGKGEHYYFQLRTIYNGEWKQDMKNGNGHQTEANGSWFEGEFKDGVRHGKGTYFDKQLNAKYSELYMNGSLKQRKQIGGQAQLLQDEFPTLKLDKQRFNTADLIGFQEKNPEIKELDLDFLLKYYGLRRIISLQFIDTPISEWTIKQVHSFLEEIGLEQYKSIFYDNKIKGKDLASLDEDQMKEDLKMRLGDRKILKSYIEYLSSLSKTKKKDFKKEEEEKRRGSLSVKKKKQSLFNTFTRSIEHEIIEEDDQWNEGYSQDQLKNKEILDHHEKRKNQYETQNWDKYISRDNIGAFYHSQNQMEMPMENKDSDKTQRGSDQDHQKQVQMSPAIKRKHSQDKQVFANPNSASQSPNAKHQAKKERSSTSSQSSEPEKNDEQEELFKIKRKKTSFIGGPSQQIRQLYEFLRENQSLDFIIKQKDIEITQVIGEGGYGKVSRGRYMQCPVAVKDYMKAGRSHKSREQFMKEVHILSDLKHPNIVLYMGLCITVNRYQLVTEFMQNGSLYDQLHIKKIKFTKQQQLQVMDDIVQGMVYLHNMKNMLHRDLKSSNVLIAEDYKVKLCDFGLSGHKNKNKKQKKNRIGTYQWMAPEVIRNEELDFFSDVYSFGVILWEMLTQQIPYSGMSETQIIGDVGYDKNHKLPNPPKGSDQFIISIMHKCLQRDPAERPTFIQIQRLIKDERRNRPYVKDVWNIL